MITNDTIGSLTTANSLNAVTASTSGTEQLVAGIDVVSSTSATITGNTVANLNNNYQGGGLDAKPYKVGDNVYAGMVLGEIPDLATLEMEARIEEIDRGRIVQRGNHSSLKEEPGLYSRIWKIQNALEAELRHDLHAGTKIMRRENT